MPRVKEVKMYGCHDEPSLSDALSDPIVRTIMNADHVDPQALEASLRATAAKVATLPRRAVERRALG
jgi:hypothetical protein